MITDARQLDDGVELVADVLIVGAGPTGIALTRALAPHGLDVLLVDSGGFRKRRDLQRLNEGVTEGDPMQSPRAIRRRQFGGTANRWYIDLDGEIGVRYAPLDAIDFLPRAGAPLTGWPFEIGTLAPYYELAQGACGLGTFDYEVRDGRPDEAPLGLDPATLPSALFELGLRDVFLRAEQELARSRTSTLLTHATVLELESERGTGRVTGARAISVGRRHVHLRASYVVLAAGGLENARLLLLSTSNHRDGIGNEHDLVGRTLMEHPRSLGNLFVPSDPSLIGRMALYDIRRRDGRHLQGRITLGEELRRREGLPGLSGMLFPRSPLHLSSDFESYSTFMGRIADKRPPLRTARDVRDLLGASPTILTHLARRATGEPAKPDEGNGGWSEASPRHRRYVAAELIAILEQSPDLENRVMLADERDAFGQPRVRIRWRVSDADKDAWRRTRAIVATEFARAGLGELRFAEPLWSVSSSHHPMGTTRMHDAPGRGVVDANCRVHGTTNLFVAGSSVFPTGGHVPPTLTVIALTLRLADHLARRAR